MKGIILTLAIISFAHFGSGQSYQQKFGKLFEQKDTVNCKRLLKEWEEANQTTPRFTHPQLISIFLRASSPDYRSDTIRYSVTITNDWIWSDNKKLEHGKRFMLETVQTYLKELYDTENDSLLPLRLICLHLCVLFPIFVINNRKKKQYVISRVQGCFAVIPGFFNSGY